jgi:hypothetical protein
VRCRHRHDEERAQDCHGDESAVHGLSCFVKTFLTGRHEIMKTGRDRGQGLKPFNGFPAFFMYFLISCFPVEK